jgi:hypothetical protein
MDPAEARRLRELEEENSKLKKLLSCVDGVWTKPVRHIPGARRLAGHAAVPTPQEGSRYATASAPVCSVTTLVVESTSRALLDAPDNITVAPDGRLYLCDETSPSKFLGWVTRWAAWCRRRRARTRPLIDLRITQWYYPKTMGTVVKTVKLPADLAATLSRKAKARGLTESALIREGIQHVTQDDDGLDMQAVVGADLGVGRGPRDLSTNRKRLSGYGRTRNR